jgi:hypothetical protein
MKVSHPSFLGATLMAFFIAKTEPATLPGLEA